MVTIKRAQSFDAESLADLAERTFRDTFTAENIPADIERHCAQNFSAEIQRSEILDPGSATLLADVESNMVACAQVRRHSAKECVRAQYPSELFRLYVSAKWQGRGVAHALMSEVLATAAGDGADCVWLGVWKKNPRAIAFYRKYGFEVVGDHVFRLGEDKQRDLIMAVETNETSVTY